MRSKMAHAQPPAAFGRILVTCAQDDVANEIRSIARAGLDGVAFGVAFLDGLPYFAQGSYAAARALPFA